MVSSGDAAESAGLFLLAVCLAVSIWLGHVVHCRRISFLTEATVSLLVGLLAGGAGAHRGWGGTCCACCPACFVSCRQVGQPRQGSLSKARPPLQRSTGGRLFIPLRLTSRSVAPAALAYYTWWLGRPMPASLVELNTQARLGSCLCRMGAPCNAMLSPQCSRRLARCRPRNLCRCSSTPCCRRLSSKRASP